MKFQNLALNFFEQTDKQTDKPKPICSPLFQSWEHKNKIDPKWLLKQVGFQMQETETT